MVMGMDAGKWMTRVTESMIHQYTESGRWRGVTLEDVALQRLRESPDRVAVVEGPHRQTYAELFLEAQRIAAGLRDLGLEPGDVVSLQLPNWWEAMAVNLAACMGGWVINPIVPIYRDAEVRFILRDCAAKVVFIPEAFRSIDYAEMLARLRPELPQLRAVVAVRSRVKGCVDYDTLGAGAAPWQSAPKSPNDIKLLLYTSGTTGRPKGVLHSHNTLMSELDAVKEFWKIGADDVVLMPSPVTHITGYTYGLEFGLVVGMKAVLMERWNAEEAMALAIREGATFTVAATPFLAELADVVERTGGSLPAFRLFASGGAPVPPEVVRRARRAMPQCVVCRVYGSSEAPTVTLGINNISDLDKGAVTDGRIVNHEVKICDPGTGEPVPAGVTGEIMTRGPEVMLGYSNPQDMQDAFDAEGFFHTGDLGFVSEDGFLTINGRSKDLIIRGGENISPKEVEDVLHTHPAVAEAALVAMPHPRLGETPCAYIVLREGHRTTLEELKEFLEQARMARQKHPERLIVLEELPKTATGKVLKHMLRARLANPESHSASVSKRVAP
jgi:acyl-CoA synthetase (AMP-forming)/AMP-acid ligase II